MKEQDLGEKIESIRNPYLLLGLVGRSQKSSNYSYSASEE